MDNPFSWDYLTTVPGTDEVFGPFAVIYLIVFGLGFLASIFLYNDGARYYTKNALKRRLIRRGSAIALTIFSIGLFFFAIRILQINPFTFGMRIWLWLSMLALVGMVGYFAYYLRVKYPVMLREYEDRKVKAQYLRPVGGATTVPRYEARRAVRRKVRR
jgi:amino acid transporter